MIDERSDELSRVQLDLHEARSRIEVLESQDQEQSRTELLEHAHNALRVVEARCESLVSEVANAEWLSEDSASSLNACAFYLTNELKESLCGGAEPTRVVRVSGATVHCSTNAKRDDRGSRCLDH